MRVNRDGMIYLRDRMRIATLPSLRSLIHDDGELFSRRDESETRFGSDHNARKRM